MAVTVEGTPSQSYIWDVASLTFSHTCGGDGLFVGVGLNTSDPDINTVTFNGDSLTEKWEQKDTEGGVSACAGYIMVAPDAGAHNVVVTLSVSTGYIWAGAVGLTGLDQVTPTRTAYKSAVSGAGGPTVTVVDSVSGDLVIDSVVTYNDTIAVGGGQTSRAEEDGLSSRSYGISTEIAAGADTVMNWTGGTYWAIGAMALVEAGGGPPAAVPAPGPAIPYLWAPPYGRGIR
jgi:hypothetical protein